MECDNLLRNRKAQIVAADDILLKCDADKMQRVFDNLLRNAVVYSYDGSQSQGPDPPRLFRVLRQAGKTAQISAPAFPLELFHHDWKIRKI